jgi:hypothetical protein
MEQIKFYEVIKKHADELAGQKSTLTRADLAYDLNSQGCQCTDDIHLSEMVYRAYIHYNRDNNIYKSFLSNEGAISLVEQYKLNAHLDDNQLNDALTLLEKDLSVAKAELNEAEKSIDTVLQLEILKAAGGVLKELEGTQQLNEIKEKGAALMQNYGKMINSYQSAEMQVKTDIKDFVDLRGNINFTLRKYAGALIDIFGDSIKMVDPNLFDFDRVKWLDVKAMQSQTELQFNQLDQNCTLLVNEVADHFNKTLNQLPVWMNSSKVLGPKNGIYGTLVVGAISYLNHFMQAQDKSIRMERELLKLKESIIKDRTQVKSDLYRLAKIHKTLNDLYIPKASAYLRLSEEVLSADLNELMNSFYNGECEQLKRERDEILNRMKELERSINDHNDNLALFNGQMKDWSGLLDSQKRNYEEAKSKKPEEPNFISKIFTGEKYKRKLHEWMVTNGELVGAYEEMLVDVELTKENIATHKDQIEKEKVEYESLSKKLKELNAKIAQKLSATPEQKLAVLKKLKDLLSLLHAGKNVVESRLDDSLLEVAQIPNPEQANKLPQEILAKYEGFCNKIVNEIRAGGTEVADDLLKEFGIEKESETAQKVTETSQQVMSKVADLLQNASYLQCEQMRSQLTEEVYRKELEKLQEEFKKSMDCISDQSKVLLEALQKANTATNKSDLRQALIEISGQSEFQLSESDFDAMLRGEKTIEI